MPAVAPFVPEGKTARTRRALLDAMERLLTSGGYAAATSTAVAAEAGVAVGTFYAYFTDREAALAELFSDRLDGLTDAVERELDLGRLLDDGVEAVLADVLGVVLDGYRRHAPTFRAALLQLPSTPVIREAYWQRYERSRDGMAAFIRRGQAAGKVRDGDPVVLADALLVIVQGLNTPVLLARPRAARTRAVRAELHRAMVELLRR